MAVRLLLAAAALLLASPRIAWALDIDTIRWGFDGHATPHSFNLLSVLVSNPEAQPFEGTIELYDSLGSGTHVGARLAEDLYVGPHSSRWVQFYPYVKERFEEWSLQWGRRAGERSDVPRPKLGTQGPVLLVDADDLTSSGGPLRIFPETLFPPFETATDALKTLALDHVPRWEESRRQSFYDWLYRGGRLHVFKDVNGAYPQFSAGLGELNAPAEKFRVGNGEVVRHDRVRSRIDAEFVEKTFGASSKGRDAAADSGDSQVDAEGDEVPSTRAAKVNPGPTTSLFVDLTGSLLAFLKSLTRPRHNWTLIYSMAAIYVLTVVPGVHILGRRRFDYRIVYGALIGLIVLFSSGFAYVGRRGHDEANSVNSVAVARQLAGGTWDVTSWSNVFVINGSDYAITHGGTANLYATAQTIEAVNGVIRNGGRGRFDVDIPPYSSQPFLHRAKIKSDLAVGVQEISADAKLNRLELLPGKNFPHPAGSDSAYVIYRDQICPMNWANERLSLVASHRETLSAFLSKVQWSQFSPYSMQFGNVGGQNLQTNVTPSFEFLLKPLIAWSLHLRQQGDIAKFTLPADRLRLFVWTQLPESMKVEGPRMGTQQGRVLYVVDIPKPVKP
jgi:hypothetical protein